VLRSLMQAPAGNMGCELSSNDFGKTSDGGALHPVERRTAGASHRLRSTSEAEAAFDCELAALKLPACMTDNVERKPRASTCAGHLVLNIRTVYLPTAKLARLPLP
jgi:hypothetical protein